MGDALNVRQTLGHYSAEPEIVRRYLGLKSIEELPGKQLEKEALES